MTNKEEIIADINTLNKQMIKQESRYQEIIDELQAEIDRKHRELIKTLNDIDSMNEITFTESIQTNTLSKISMLEVLRGVLVIKEAQAKKALSMSVSIQDKSFHRGRVYELEDVVIQLIKILGE